MGNYLVDIVIEDYELTEDGRCPACKSNRFRVTFEQDSAVVNTLTEELEAEPGSVPIVVKVVCESCKVEIKARK